MKKELIDIINRLKNSPSILISVINKETGQPLVRSFSADRFVERYGSVENLAIRQGAFPSQKLLYSAPRKKTPHHKLPPKSCPLPFPLPPFNNSPWGKWD